jgi:hypothetical protein
MPKVIGYISPGPPTDRLGLCCVGVHSTGSHVTGQAEDETPLVLLAHLLQACSEVCLSDTSIAFQKGELCMSRLADSVYRLVVQLGHLSESVCWPP